MTPTESGVSPVGGRLFPSAWRIRRPRPDHVELTLACAFLAAVGLAGLYFLVRPGPTALDRFVFSVIPGRPRSAYVIAVTRLGSAPVVGVGAAAGFVATVRRDVARAVALLVGPLSTVLVTDVVLKPVVGRTFDGVLSYPSGSVAAVAALATVAVLATPDRWRWGAGVVGGTASLLMALAVVALGWHYPTDALAGLALGPGTVLVLDWGARRLGAVWARDAAGDDRDGEPRAGHGAVDEAGRLARR